MKLRRALRGRRPPGCPRYVRAVGRAWLASFLLFPSIGVRTGTAHALPAFTATAVLQPGKITDPKVAATRLYDAWRRKNRAAALKVAERETVNKLFSVRWRAMRSRGCERREEGGFQCIYYDTKNDFSLSFNVDGGASAGYAVESVSFSTEE